MKDRYRVWYANPKYGGGKRCNYIWVFIDDSMRDGLMLWVMDYDPRKNHNDIAAHDYQILHELKTCDIGTFKDLALKCSFDTLFNLDKSLLDYEVEL